MNSTGSLSSPARLFGNVVWKMVENYKSKEEKSSSRAEEEAIRVVHLTTVHNSFDPRIFYKQLRSLREAGFDSHLVAPHDRAECRNGITIHALSESTTRVGRFLLHPQAFFTAQALDADLYQIHDPELIPVAYLLKKTTGAQVVYDMHEDYRSKSELLGRALRMLERWCFRWVDHVLLAEESYRSIVEEAHVPHTCILNYFIPIGEEGRKRTARTESSSPKRLLYTGTVSRSRGLNTMLDLAALIREGGQSEQLDIVGICHRAEQRVQAENRIQQDGLDEIIDRIGWNKYVHPMAMSPYYSRGDVGLALFEPHPNHVQSLLTKFYEYLYYGLPIICSDFPLWRHFIEEHDCGVVVPPGNAEAVMDVLTRWQERPEVYWEYVQNARAAAPLYRWEQMGERLVQLYQTLLSTQKSTS